MTNAGEFAVLMRHIELTEVQMKCAVVGDGEILTSHELTQA
jgi:hypothetical protein